MGQPDPPLQEKGDLHNDIDLQYQPQAIPPTPTPTLDDAEQATASSSVAHSGREAAKAAVSSKRDAPVPEARGLASSRSCRKQKKLLTFMKCGHKVSCQECSSRLPACPVCLEDITVTQQMSPRSAIDQDDNSGRDVACVECGQRRRHMIQYMPCGHMSCKTCSEEHPITHCPDCGSEILRKISRHDRTP